MNDKKIEKEYLYPPEPLLKPQETENGDATAKAYERASKIYNEHFQLMERLKNR